MIMRLKLNISFIADNYRLFVINCHNFSFSLELAGPNLDLLCVRQSDAEERDLMTGCEIFGALFGQYQMLS